MKLVMVIIASCMACFGNVVYVKDLFKGRVHPHPYTWGIWTIVSCVTFFGQLQKGAGIGAIPTGVAEAFTILIFICSLWFLWRGKNVGHIRTVDHYFLAIALAGLIPWIYTSDPTLSIIIVVAIDVIAFIPTLRKTWLHPHTEQPLLYEMNVTRHALTLASLGAYNIATTLHSVAMIATNILMSIFIRRKRK